MHYRKVQIVAFSCGSIVSASNAFASRGGEFLFAPVRAVFEILFDVLIYEPLQIWFVMFVILAGAVRLVFYAKKIRLTWNPPGIETGASMRGRVSFWIMYVSTILACATLAVGFILNIIL